MATDIDLRTISNFSSLPESTINGLLDAPSTETVRLFLKSIEKSSKECEQSKSQKAKLEVELETVVRTNESKVKVLQNSRDKALADVQNLRSDVQNAENNRARAEANLEQFRSTISTEASENAGLKSRISSLESSNRDIVAALESKTKSYERLSQDLSAAHQKSVDLRSQITSLEQTVQSANSSVSSSKFREQSLQREVEQLQKNNEWLQGERDIKAEEHKNFRKEKNARIAELTRTNEHYIAESETLKRSEVALKHRLDELSNKYEDSVQEIQRLQEEKLAEAESFRVELESTNRLAKLREEQAITAQERVEELQNDLDELKDETADELGRLRTDAQNDHADKEAAERKIAELESNITLLQSEIESARARPSTPQQPVNTNGAATPMRPSTPLGIFSPSGGTRPKGQPSVTQLFSEYKKLEKELATEKRNNEELQSSLDTMVQELESSKPELDEIRSDHSRLQSELLEMSSIMDLANKEKDASAKEARAYQGQLHAKNKEIEDLTQQTRDLGSELRYLLMEQHIRENGGSFTQEDFDKLQRAADDAMRQETANLSETQQLVNQQLIVFKNVSELQQQNANQLKTIRNLVENLESNESQERQQKFASMDQELQEARGQVASLQSEIKTMLTQTKSFAKERDMFRSMLKRSGVSQVTDFSKSLPIPAPGSPPKAFDESSLSGGTSDLSKALKEMQETFDSHRKEFNTNTSMLRAQVDDLTKRNSQIQLESSRALGQLAAANQRAEMLQGNYNMLKTENSELQKRSYATSEDAAKQAVKVQQASEELVEARGMLDSLRRESANLKAEKDLFKSVEKRYIDENETLRNERSRVDQLNTSLQTLLNEREQADSEQRRRLQSQVELLETEAQTAKRKLNDELEESRKTSLRREYEQEQAQKRIDDLMASLSSAREELAATKTARDHLQARVDELAVELRSAEERLEVYTRPAEPANQPDGDVEPGISKEEELTIQVSELKRDLELKTSELDRANEQIETYKNIAQEAEERLQETNETADLYRENTESTLAENESKIKDLEQRLEDISTELNTTNSELSKLRDEYSGADRRLEEQRASFEAEIERLKQQEKRASEQAQFQLDATKAQAQIAEDAQQNYENEIVKNAEAIKAAQGARAEANQLRLQMVDLKTQAETAQTNLQQKESSWSEMKDRYEQEVTDLKRRREEVAQQNTILHGQLESLTQQIAALQRDRADLATRESAEGNSDNLANLQEVIKYLRREKEIVDVQYHLSTQEAKRLRQQLDLAHSQLDDTRLKLDQQRRAEADSERNVISHNKLMDTLNELNLFRESSVTLRAEAKQASQSLAEKSQQVEKLEAQIQPLQARISELENLVELRDGENKLLSDDRDHWRQRTQNILSKYDRVDPAELESMKEKLSELEKERDEAYAARDSLQTQVDGISEQIESARSDLRTRLGDQFKAKTRELGGKIREKQIEVDSVTAEKSALQSELDVVREQLESARNQAAPAVQVNGDSARSPGEVEDGSGELEAKVAALQASIEEKDGEIAALKAEQEEKVKAKQEEMRGVLNKRMSDFKQELEKAKQTALEELRQSLESQHQQELEELRSQSVPVSAELRRSSEASKAADGVSADDAAPTTNQAVSDEQLLALNDAKAKWFANNHPAAKKLLVDNIRAKVRNAQEDFEKKLVEARQASENDGSEEQIREMETRFSFEKEALVQEKESEFATEKEQMEKNFEERLAQEKQELIAQHEAEFESQKKIFDEESKKSIAEQVARAEQMAAQKGKVQVNMANNRAAAAVAKLKIVETAAKETPDKAVSEVWEVASKAKPAPVAPPAQAAQPLNATPITANSAPNVSTAPATTPQPTQSVADTTQNIVAAMAKGADHPTTEGAQQPAANASQAGSNDPAKPSAPAGPNALQKASGLPQPHARGGSIRGRGGIPQPGAGRGTGIPRGAPAGARGRGGHRTSSVGTTGIPSAPGGRGGGGAGAQSPRTSLNPNANQFVPGGNNNAAGAKRAREDGDAGDSAAGQQGKRIRGGVWEARGAHGPLDDRG